MNTPQHSDPTVLFYEQNASVFSLDTGSVDMAHIYAEFLPFLPKGGRILDAGCGSGRDSVFFKRKGFSVKAFDASKTLAEVASRTLGEPVEVMTFLDLEAGDEYDGIWACASLLHVHDGEMDDVLQRLMRSLKKSGVLYASFKYGTTEGFRNGRYFNDFDEKKITDLLVRHPLLKLQRMWKTRDSRPGRNQEWWLNAIMKKTVRVDMG
ncbi:MAG: class I SAM-dependent methyltransferase [Desulfobacterales bacterium]|nr:class I SAM-dependent methyltransferase [Desulfobacterales bacterium]